MTEPLISVVIATWNTGRYLPETLMSAFAQTHRRTEIIVVDDGSTDDTAERVGPFLSRIHLIRREHAGLAAARNAGIAEARGEYIALLDADDIWLPEKLATQLAVAQRHPEAGLVVCDGVHFEGDTVLRESLFSKALIRRLGAAAGRETIGRLHREFLASTPLFCPAQTLIPKPVLDSIGPFIDSPAQDYECYLRIAKRHPVALHSDSLVRWRYRPDSMSGPREARAKNTGWATLDVLANHAARCNAAERRIISRRRGRLVRSLARGAYRRRATTGGYSATRREIIRLMRAKPWPPVALFYLIRLMAAAPFSQLAKVRRMRSTSKR